MNSQEYRFIFSIRDREDIPADYRAVVKQLTFDTGIFLPQDDSNQWMSPPQFPARLLLLNGLILHIIPHPLSEEPPVLLPLDDLLQFETGDLFLLGWLKFTTAQNVFELRYNRRAIRPLGTFLRDLNHRWTSLEIKSPAPTPHLYGEALDLKFLSALQDEVRDEEQIAWQYFAAPRKFEYKQFCFRREAWTAGHLLLVTSASRLVWITDQYRNYREFYASIVRSALLSALSNIHLTQYGEQWFLEMIFRGAPSWRLPVEGGGETGSQLQRTLRQIAAAPGGGNTERTYYSAASQAIGQQEA